MRRFPQDPSRPPKRETQAIRLAARVALPEERRDALLRLLGGRIRWDRLLREARASGILPLLAHHVRGDPDLRSAVPPEPLAVLEETWLQTVARNMLLFRALEEVLGGFASREIPVIPLKGAYLIPEVYGRVDLRTASDLDLLVRKEDLRGIDAALADLGYIPHRDVRRFLDAKSDPSITSAFYRRPDEDRYFIDLRWHLVEIPACLDLGIFPVSMERVWEESLEWAYEGRPARCLSPIHHFLYVALHALKHSFDPVLFLTDLAEFWDWGKGSNGSGPRIDLEELWAEAEAFGLSRTLEVAMRLCREVVGGDFPEEILPGLTSKRITPWERIFLRSVLGGRSAPGAAYLFYLGLLQGADPKLRLIRQTFFPAREAIFWADEEIVDDLGVIPRGLRALRGARMALEILRG